MEKGQDNNVLSLLLYVSSAIRKLKVLRFSYLSLVYGIRTLAHPVETLADYWKDVLFGLDGLFDQVLDALDPALIHVLQVLEHRGQLVVVVVALKG